MSLQTSKLTADDIQNILIWIDYPGYTFCVGGSDRLWIQATFVERCAVDGMLALQSTRKWYVSEHACKSEVVQTALKIVLTSLEHEAREKFTYRGRAVFGPHFDVDALHGLCEVGAFNRRPGSAQ